MSSPTLYDYQLKMLDGFKKGEMSIISSGRQLGKSTYYQYAKQWEEVMNKRKPLQLVSEPTLVDGETWYTVSCTAEVATWFRSTYKDSEGKQWYSHIDPRNYIYNNAFDMHEQLFTMLAMKYPC